MSDLVLHDTQYGRVDASCSPRLIKFVHGITSERFPNLVSVALSDKNGGASAVRIDSSLRTFSEQVDLYKKGRSIQWSMIPLENKVVGYKSAYALNLDTKKIVKAGQSVTNAFAGQSYHNYGLAVDVVFRKYGWSTPGGFQYYIDTGLVDWAKQCGLEWGGDWRNTGNWGPNGDMVHFQDANYNIPINFTESYTYDNGLGRTFSYNPAWVRGNDNFKWVCEYNGLSYAAELEKMKREGGSGDGLKPDTSDKIKNEIKNKLWIVGGVALALFYLNGKRK